MLVPLWLKPRVLFCLKMLFGAIVAKMPQSKRAQNAPWTSEARCCHCNALGKSCANTAGGHEAWCFRKQGWVKSTGGAWYCPVCRPEAEELGWVRERTPQEIASIEIQCWCADGAHAPWKCPACQGFNWAWRKACRHCGGATPDDGAAARRPDPVNVFYPPNHPGAAAADPLRPRS